MRLIQRLDNEEELFTEGEPELHAPEEFALIEVDDEYQLEEEIDNEDLAEEDVDDDVLQATLENLDESQPDKEAVLYDMGLGSEPEDESSREAEIVVEIDLDDLDTEDELYVSDFEIALDQALITRLDLRAEDLDGEDEPLRLEQFAEYNIDISSAVAPCRHDEFVCRKCYLVHNRSQMDPRESGVCADCAG